MKVTDLDKFVLEQVYRPYWGALMGSDYPRLDNLTGNHNLDTVMNDLLEKPEWARLVLERIYRCEFTFPYYIVHPLVSHIAESSRQYRESKIQQNSWHVD